LKLGMWGALAVITLVGIGIPYLKMRKNKKSGEQIPLNKLKPVCDDDDKPLVVLLGCGSYSPITNMHLRIFEQARNWLMYEKKKFDIVGGFLSPVHNAYGKAGLVPDFHRIRMCQLGAESSDWISVATWETKQTAWTQTYQVLEVYQKAINDAKPYKRSVQVKLICGADLLESFNTKGMWNPEHLEIILGRFGVVCIERSETEPLDGFIRTSPILSKFADNIELVPQRVSNTVSSSGIREHLKNNLSVKYLVPDSVIDYIYQNNVYGHQISQDVIIRSESYRNLPVLDNSLDLQ